MNKKINNTPLEYYDQIALVDFLELKKLKFTAIPNSTYTKSIKQKMKNTAQGLRAGFPDLIILLPNKMLCLELKREFGGVLNENQKEWIDALNALGGNIEAIVCKGYEEAKNAVESHLNAK